MPRGDVAATMAVFGGLVAVVGTAASCGDDPSEAAAESNRFVIACPDDAPVTANEILAEFSSIIIDNDLQDVVDIVVEGPNLVRVGDRSGQGHLSDFVALRRDEYPVCSFEPVPER